jgi:very-short-patch-repair endonuclease
VGGGRDRPGRTRYSRGMASPAARKLRKNPTEAEKLFWNRVRARQLDGFRFRRQAPIGNYVVDFVCPEGKLIVELDGGQHDAEADKDSERSAGLESKGYRVVRFWNNQMFENIEGVLETPRSSLRKS